jgi:Cu/Ag efflux pump CusA
MTLGGLAIALSEVVDDAIVDVENVLRRLGENGRRQEPLPVLQVILDASLEVRSAVVYASFIVALVFLPIFFLEGLGGRFFRPLGYAYVTAIMVSLAVAVTVTPALCLILLPRRRLTRHADPPLMRFLKCLYGHAFGAVLRRPPSRPGPDALGRNHRGQGLRGRHGLRRRGPRRSGDPLHARRDRRTAGWGCRATRSNTPWR